MTGFLLRRLGYAVPVLLGVTVVVFLTVTLIPGDPAALLAGPGATPDAVAAVRERMGLDQALPVQYWQWLSRAAAGDLGESIAKHQPVAGLVLDAFANSAVLAGYAGVLALLSGVLLGGAGAAAPRSALGRVSSAVSAVSISLPQYSLGLILIIYGSVQTGWFPVSGMHTSGRGGLADLLWHGFLPAVTAGLVPAGVIARIVRSALLDVLAMDFVEALRARGVSDRRILLHAAHNTLPSLLTVAGLQAGYLLGGVVFVETIFAWPGLGQLIFQSVGTRDLPVVQAGVLVSAVAFVLINIAVDATHGLVDPRVRTA